MGIEKIKKKCRYYGIYKSQEGETKKVYSYSYKNKLKEYNAFYNYLKNKKAFYFAIFCYESNRKLGYYDKNGTITEEKKSHYRVYCIPKINSNKRKGDSFSMTEIDIQNLKKDIIKNESLYAGFNVYDKKSNNCIEKFRRNNY